MRTEMSEFLNNAVDRYSNTIIKIAFQHTRCRADAEDIAQDVFLALYRKQPKLSDEAHLKAWLIRAAINASRNRAKSADRKNVVPLNEEITPDLETGYELDDEKTALLEALQKLSEGERNVVYLYYYEGYSAKEIAAIIGKRESSVFMSLSRARERLRELFSEE